MAITGDPISKSIMIQLSSYSGAMNAPAAVAASNKTSADALSIAPYRAQQDFLLPLVSGTSEEESIYRDSKIYQYALSEFIRGNSQNWKKGQVIMGVKSILALGSTAGRLPFIPISLRAGKGHPIAGSFYAVANLIGFSSYYVWASFKMVNRVIVSLNSAEKIGSGKSSRLSRVGVIFGAIVMGTGGQIPAIVLAVDNNKTRPEVVLLNGFDEILPIYSMYMLLDNQILNNPCFLSPAEKKMFDIKKEVTGRIRQRYTDYITKPGETKKIDEFFASLKRSSDEEHEKLLKLFGLIMDESLVHDVSSDSYCFQGVKISAQGIGIVLTAVQLAWNGLLAYNGMNKLAENEVASWTLAIYVALCSLALTQKVLIDTSTQAIVSTGNLLRGRNDQTYISEALYPKVSTGAKVSCLAISLFAYAVATQMSEDYLPSDFQVPSAVLYSAGFIIMSYLPIRELSDWLLQEWAMAKGSKEEKHFTLTAQQISRLAEYIDSASPKSVAKFLLSVENQEFVQSILTKYALERANLVSMVTA